MGIMADKSDNKVVLLSDDSLNSQNINENNNEKSTLAKEAIELTDNLNSTNNSNITTSTFTSTPKTDGTNTNNSKSKSKNKIQHKTSFVVSSTPLEETKTILNIVLLISLSLI